MSGGTERVVCVTGASGYIASWLVKLLLQRGYTVKASVRDPNEPQKTEHLLALDGAKERLRLFKADLEEEGSFDSAIDGCEGVFHTASPVLDDFTDPQAELIDPAVKGTLNVLRACAKVSSVKRVVVTSSMAAVAYSGRTIASDVVIDETWFSDPAICEKSKLWYMLSKTLAEEAAWKFAKENGIDMVTMNPGAERTLDIQAVWVDVRDIANAHILAYENPSANGRYCLVASTISCSWVMKILRELYPTLNLPENKDDKPLELICKVSKEKAESLGLNFIPVEVTLKDTVESLREKNFLTV
ncbi:Tetraketide alpha-pyrone reductase 1 [Morella rubra]|uniref:Tetraketide alpha-pyrone reductase 1 n=1 Tax=Morella rubra TaxID=262757 RepID=A0A6A1WML8_9ROSI|nr:Tetraketide alpha-pyrone reductase 1 [Morella rubra]